MPIFKQHFDCILRGSKRIYAIAVQRSSCVVIFVTYWHFVCSYTLWKIVYCEDKYKYGKKKCCQHFHRK